MSDLSTIQNLGEGRIALNRLQTIQHYIHEYLTVLTQGGHHIIHSVPTYRQGALLSYGLTDVTCQVVSQTEVTTRNCTRIARCPIWC